MSSVRKQGIAAYACIVHKDKILLLHRIEGFDVWEFPGGKIEYGENPKDAAIREAKEETGLIVEGNGKSYIGSCVTPQGVHEVNLIYNCRIRKLIKIKITEHIDYGWFTINDMIKIKNLALSVQSVLKQLKNDLNANI